MENNKYIHNARHAIGLDHKKPYKRHGKMFYKPYRNYFCCEEDNEIWLKLESFGYAGHEDTSYGCVYYLTQKGLHWLGRTIGVKIYEVDD